MLIVIIGPNPFYHKSCKLFFKIQRIIMHHCVYQMSTKIVWLCDVMGSKFILTCARIWSITAGYNGESLQTFGHSGLGFHIATCIRGIENGLWTFGYKQYPHVSLALGPWHPTRSLCNHKVLTSMHL